MSSCNCGTLVGILAVIIALIFYFLPRFRKWIAGGTFNRNTSLENKIVVITGCNTGIGKETAKDLAKRGAHVVMACRNMKKTENAVADIKKEVSKAKISVVELDLSSFESVRACAKKILALVPKIDILINNAGVYMSSYTETKDGFEMQFGTNHLGHFLLTNLLLDKIKASAPSRIVNVASLLHSFPGTRMNWDDINFKKNYSAFRVYCQSKLANVLFTKELAEKLKGTGVTTYSLHPGAINTELDRDIKGIFYSVTRFNKLFFKTATQGAQTTIYCAVAEELANETGLYYSDCKEKVPSKRARNKEDAKRLWDLSVVMTKL